MKKGIQILSALVLLGLANASSPVAASGFDWSTGQGLVDTCSRMSIPREKATQDDAAMALLCIVQFKTWRNSWTVEKS